MSLEPHVVVLRPVQTYRPAVGSGWYPPSPGGDSPLVTCLQVATCSCWLKVYGLVLWFLLFQVGFISFSSFGKSSLHLPWRANAHKQSGLKQRNQVQGQIDSTAVIRKLSTVFLVLTHSRRSDLIGSRLVLYMDLKTPKVWEFTSGVLAIGLKVGKIGEKGLFSNRGKTRSRKIRLTRGTTGRNIYPFIAQCCFSCTYIFCMCTTLPVLLGA